MAPNQSFVSFASSFRASTSQARLGDPMSSKQHGCLSLLLLARNLNLKAWYCLGVLVVHSRASLTVCSLACHGVIESQIE